MNKFLKHDVNDIVRTTKIAYVTDAEIWRHLVTPMVRSLLGRIDFSKCQSRLVETIAGLFPADEVTNLNDHRMFGGQQGFIRYPYLHNFYPTENGAFIVKRDGVKFEAFAWFGDVFKGRGELIFKAALRDRRYDGTRKANDTSLVDFPYDDATLNAPLPHDVRSVELSIYGFLPGSRVVAACGDREFDLFVEKPFVFLDRPQKFLELFKRAWESQRAPGQNAAPIPDVSKLVPPQFEKVATRKGYDFIEVAPSHYHVAMWAVAVGYRFTDAKQAETIRQLSAGIKRLKDSGMKLTRQQESWVCVAQSLPREFIPAGLDLGGPVWPQDNIGPQNLWMNKPLTEKARKVLP